MRMLNPDASASGAPSTAPPADRPHLVLTTGTTGAPRGVRHDWSRLLRSTGTHRARTRPAVAARLRPAPVRRPADPAARRSPPAPRSSAPAPRRPREGLAAMRAHGVDARQRDADLLAVPARRAARRRRRRCRGSNRSPSAARRSLPRCSPSCAARSRMPISRRCTPPASSARADRCGTAAAAFPRDVLWRGDDADVAMKIVDGELWVRSRVGMLGYYGEPPVDPDAWRPTGDLVDVVDDRIVFRGRTSEVINVGGVKVHPLPDRGAHRRSSRGRRRPGVRPAQSDDRRHRRGRDRSGAGRRPRTASRPPSGPPAPTCRPHPGRAASVR